MRVGNCCLTAVSLLLVASRHSQLRPVALSCADLTETRLAHRSLERGNFSGADLRQADLQHCNLRRADLSHACLQGADLRGADLQGVNLRCANLIAANLRGARLDGVDFAGAAFSQETRWPAGFVPAEHGIRGPGTGSPVLHFTFTRLTAAR